MLRRSVLGLSLLVMAIYHTCDTCSPPIHWKPQEVSKRAAIADIVIVGKVVRSPHRRATREREARLRRRKSTGKVGLYDARIEVLCALKGGPLPQFVQVSGFGQMHGHCVNSPALQNATYVGFLRERKGRYRVAEVNNQRGMIPFKQHLVRSIGKEIGSARKSCANIFVKNSRGTTTPAMDSAEVIYFDPVKAKAKVNPTTERTLPAASLEDGSNGASTTKIPVWEAPVLMLVYFLGHLLT